LVNCLSKTQLLGHRAREFFHHGDILLAVAG